MSDAREAGLPNEDTLNAIRKVLEGFESGVFVRNIERDAEPGWTFRLAPFLQALSVLARAVPDPAHTPKG